MEIPRGRDRTTAHAARPTTLCDPPDAATPVSAHAGPAPLSAHPAALPSPREREPRRRLILLQSRDDLSQLAPRTHQHRNPPRISPSRRQRAACATLQRSSEHYLRSAARCAASVPPVPREFQMRLRNARRTHRQHQASVLLDRTASAATNGTSPSCSPSGKILANSPLKPSTSAGLRPEVRRQPQTRQQEASRCAPSASSSQTAPPAPAETDRSTASDRPPETPSGPRSSQPSVSSSINSYWLVRGVLHLIHQQMPQLHAKRRLQIRRHRAPAAAPPAPAAQARQSRTRPAPRTPTATPLAPCSARETAPSPQAIAPPGSAPAAACLNR